MAQWNYMHASLNSVVKIMDFHLNSDFKSCRISII